MAVDENNFYILVKCYSSGTKFVTPSLRRDFRAGGSDNITFLLDPNGDRTTAYFFGINPIISFTSLFNMRYLQYLTLTGTFNYNKIQMPAPYSSNNIWLIGPRIDLTMTRNFFLTGFFQYNSLASNININARMQWRYAPVSDFYLVYTDNYYSDNFKIKNRAIAAKLTYWLNM